MWRDFLWAQGHPGVSAKRDPLTPVAGRGPEATCPARPGCCLSADTQRSCVRDFDCEHVWFRMLPKPTKHQQKKVEETWESIKPQLLIAVRQHYGQLKILLTKAEQDANKSVPNWGAGAWLKEERQRRRTAAIKSFCHSHGFFLDSRKGIQNSILFERARKTIMAKSASLERQFKKAGFDADSMPVEGHAFEYWVAANLRRFGWSTEVTSGSGDQGVDILASFDNRKLAIQCKRYAGTVGNKAVQEAHSGGVFYKTDAAAVISNANFTRSAIALADSAGMLLCSIDEIPTLSATFLCRLAK